MVSGGSIEAAILATVAYLDIFACAPSTREIHRFLLGRRASRAEVEAALRTSPELRRTLGTRDGYWFLSDKDHLAPRRVRFARHSAALWPRARRMARLVERTGLASSGMVTGSLAADNADEHADVDFLFTYPGDRTWTSYGAVRLIAKLPALGLDKLCANYVLADDALEIRPQNVFTAWELAKAVPMFGFDVYRRLVLSNPWVSRYLPNALPLLHETVPDLGPPAASRLARAVTSSRAFRALEAMEKRRKFARDERDVGVDMAERAKAGSTDRHSPTRSFHVLSELRYRMRVHGLEDHPLFADLAPWASGLAREMVRWGNEPVSGPQPTLGAGEGSAPSELAG